MNQQNIITVLNLLESVFEKNLYDDKFTSAMFEYVRRRKKNEQTQSDYWRATVMDMFKKSRMQVLRQLWDGEMELSG